MNLPNYKEARNRLKNYHTVKYDIEKSIINKYSGKTYFLKTYGCQMNEHDSENIRAMLEELGFKAVEDYTQADLIMLNTCSIRENAHNKAFGMLGRCKNLKEENPNLIVGICGCMAQEEGVVNEILHKYKWVNFVMGTHNMYRLPYILDQAIEENNQQIEVFSKEGDLVESIPVKRDNGFKAWVNIIYGCDKFCTYCIVPYTRGRERSRKMEEVLEEVKALKEQGYMEITLLGQNVNAYGKDLNLGYDFATLLENVAKIGIPRIRFVTSHPWNFTDRMVDVIAKYDNIMPYVHLPIQSGSDEILKRMNRKYTIEEYKKLFDQIKKKVKNVAITTDIIVGFPNETDEDFQKTLDIVNYCKFDGAYTFIFSPREGTAAAKMEDKVPMQVKEERLQKLNELVNKYSLESNQKMLGKTLDVLVVGLSEKDSNKVYGYTETMKLVNIVSNKDLIGKIVPVKITDAKSFSLDGENSQE